MAEPRDLEAKLIRHLALMKVADQARLSGDTKLKEIGMDSMRMVELFVFVEKEFGIELMNSTLGAADLETIGSLASFIAARG